jgi:hypothetical protein
VGCDEGFLKVVWEHIGEHLGGSELSQALKPNVEDVQLLLVGF